MEQIIYQEKQQFRQPWLWFVLISITALTVFVTTNIQMKNNFINGRDMGNGSGGAIFGIVISFLVILLFFLTNLDLKLSSTGIQLKFFPLVLKPKLYLWEEIKSIKLRKYQPLQEFGGWGIRIGLGKRIAYSVSGNFGLELFMNDGRIIMIGIKNPKMIEQTILGLNFKDYERNGIEFD